MEILRHFRLRRGILHNFQRQITEFLKPSRKIKIHYIKQASLLKESSPRVWKCRIEMLLITKSSLNASK